MKPGWILALTLLALLWGGAAQAAGEAAVRDAHEAHDEAGHHHDDDDDDDHVAVAGDLRIVHAWARAAPAGTDTLVFFELSNEGEADVLEGAGTEVAASVAIVGFAMVDGRASHVEIGALDIAHGDFDFDPHGVGLRLSGLARGLEKGDHFDLSLRFAKAGDVAVHVDVEAADATRHSHAGHSH